MIRLIKRTVLGVILAVWVGISAAWLASFWYEQGVWLGLAGTKTGWHEFAGRGQIEFQIFHFDAAQAVATREWYFTRARSEDDWFPLWKTRFGFALFHQNGTMPPTAWKLPNWVIVVPFW